MTRYQAHRPEAAFARTIAAGFVGILLGAAILAGSGARPVPHCEEDAAIVGVGLFEDGRWSEYVCGPAVDDYTERG